MSDVKRYEQARAAHDPELTEGWEQNYVAVAGVETTPRHIARLSFREELVALLERHGITYDERYLLG